MVTGLLVGMCATAAGFGGPWLYALQAKHCQLHVPEAEQKAVDRPANGRGEQDPAEQPLLAGAISPGHAEGVVAGDEQAPDEARQAKDREERRQIADLVAQQVMGCTAIWMAVFTAFQVVIGGVGLFALFRTLRLTRDSVEKAGVSAKASERAADAAIAAVSIAKDTAERQLRAYVSCTKARLVDFTAGSEPYAMLTFRNAGSTPAQSITVMCHIYFRPHPPHHGDVIIHAPGRETSISLGPSQEVEIKGGVLHGVGGPRPSRIDLDEEKALRSGDMAFYVHVDLRYRDIFGTRNIVEQRFMFTRDCLQRADGEADVCPYGNQHCYGLKSAS